MKFRLLCLVCVLALLPLLAACGEPAVPPLAATAAVPTPEPSKGNLTGRVLSNTDQQPIKQMAVYLAPVYCNPERTNCAFAQDQARSPVAQTNLEGLFVFSNVDPGEYVLVVGDSFGGMHDIVREENGDARVYKLEAGQTAEAGAVQVSPNVTNP